MRLSDWRAAAPTKEAGSAKVAAVVDPVLAALGTGADPHGWIAWGEEPGTRYTILVPTEPGLVVVFVRVLVPGEGPRASGKLVRWNRVAVGELAMEAQQGHRILSIMVEGQVLRGVDIEADRVAAFALRLLAAIDGRPLPPVVEGPARRAGASAPTSGRTRRTANPAPPAAAKAGRKPSAEGSRSALPARPTAGAKARSAGRPSR